MLILLTGCEDEEAQKFIKQNSTLESAQEMVVEAMKQEGLDVSAEGIHYDNEGKRIDPSVIVVDYVTLHAPEYRGRAFLKVDLDATPRKLAEVSHLGLEYTDGLVPIGTVLIKHLKGIAYQFMIPDVESVMESFPELSWEEERERIKFDEVQYKKETLHELVRLYGEDRIANPSEEEAKQWVNQYELSSSAENESVFWLTFVYDGEMANGKFEEILQAFVDNDHLPKGSYTIRISADRFVKSEEPLYNKRSNGEGSEVFIGKYNTHE